jgi:hypothetical protein
LLSGKWRPHEQAHEAQAQTQTLVTMVSVWVIIAITLIANLILLILYRVPSQIA